MQVDLVDQSGFEQLPAHRRREDLEVVAVGRVQPEAHSSAGPPFKTVTPLAGVASLGWWVSTKTDPSMPHRDERHDQLWPPDTVCRAPPPWAMWRLGRAPSRIVTVSRLVWVAAVGTSCTMRVAIARIT